MMFDAAKIKQSPISQMTEFDDMSISVGIVNYNAGELLRACLKSIEAETPAEVILIDNASSDGSNEMVMRDFPWVRLIRLEKNDGYGAAANLAVASCSSKYVLLLNCDTELHIGALEALRDHLDQHPRVAIVGPSLVNPDGTPQPSCFPFPTPLNTFLKETSLSRFGSGNLSYSSPSSARPVPWVLGAALAIRRSAFEAVGGFDPSFFMYFEEVDLCYRFRQAGWQTHFTPAATVTHVGGASTRQQRAEMVVQLYKSLCHFYQLHYAQTQSLQLKLVLTYVMMRNAIKMAFKKLTGMYARHNPLSRDDTLVWRTILSRVWSANGWLSQ